MFKKGFVILTSLFLLISSQTPVFGQFPSDIWNPQYLVAPAGTIIRGVDFQGISLGCAVGYDGANGVILVTNDGVNWGDSSSAVTGGLVGITLNDVSFADVLNGVAVGTGGKIFYTTDGGNTWNIPTTNPATLGLNSVVMIFDGTSIYGWAVGNDGTIFTTSDGGDIWSDQSGNITPALVAGDHLNAVDLVWNGTSFNGIAVGVGGEVVFTTNGGTTWSSAPTTAPLAVNYYGFSYFYDGASTYFGCAVGIDGRISTTPDGDSWTDKPIQLPTGGVLNGVEFISATEGWAVGKSTAGPDSGIVLRTEDGGANWKLQRNFDPLIPTSPPRELFDVAIAFDQYGGGPFGWAVGGDGLNNGVILNYPTYRVYMDAPTSVSGAIDDPFSFPISVAERIEDKYHVSGFVINIIWDNTIASADVTPYDISNTRIKGIGDFIIQYNEIADATIDTLKIAGASAFFLNGYGELMSLNFVLSNNIATPTDPLIQFEHLMFNIGLPGVIWQYGPPPAWFGDANGDKMLTTDDATLILQYRVSISGAIISPENMEKANVSGIMGITAYDASLVLQKIASIITQFPVEMSKASAFGDNSKAEIVVSKESKNSNVVIYQIKADKINGVLSAGLEINYDCQSLEYIGCELSEYTRDFLIETEQKDDGVLYVAIAGSEDLNKKAELISLRFEKTGDNVIDINLVSAILNETNVEAISNVNKNLPNKFEIYQNYPNPFNPETNIHYQIPKESKVVLKIYNILGQEVKTLVDEIKSAGFYSVKWDARNDFGRELASGIYFYRISAGDFNKTMKLILIK